MITKRAATVAVLMLCFSIAAVAQTTRTLSEGTEIALVDPTAAKPAAGPASTSPMPGGSK